MEESKFQSPVPAQWIKILGIVNILWLIFWAWFLGLIVNGVIYVLKQEEMNEEERKAYLNTFNFYISILIYSTISAILMIVLIGFAMLFILAIFAVIVFVIGLIKNLSWENYEYPLMIQFFKTK